MPERFAQFLDRPARTISCQLERPLQGWDFLLHGQKRATPTFSSHEPFAAQRVPTAERIQQRASDVDHESTRLRRALDSAIYALEHIKRRAESASTSDNANWDCLVIAEAADATIERISERCRAESCEARHPALKNLARYQKPASA